MKSKLFLTFSLLVLVLSLSFALAESYNSSYNRSNTNNYNSSYNRSNTNNYNSSYNRSNTNNYNSSYNRSNTDNYNSSYNRSNTDNYNSSYNRSYNPGENRIMSEYNPNLTQNNSKNGLLAKEKRNNRNMTLGQCKAGFAKNQHTCIKTAQEKSKQCKIEAKGQEDRKTALKLCIQDYKDETNQCKSTFKLDKTECDGLMQKINNSI